MLCSSHTAFLLALKLGKCGPTPRPSGASGVTLLRSKTPLPGSLLQPPSLEQPLLHTALSQLLSPRTFIL